MATKAETFKAQSQVEAHERKRTSRASADTEHAKAPPRRRGDRRSKSGQGLQVKATTRQRAPSTRTGARRH